MKKSMSKDYYKVLGVDKSATDADIKKAYRAKAKEHHPDKGGNEAEFKRIQEAYEVLSDTQKRSQYDRFGSVNNGSNQQYQHSGFDNMDFGGININDIFEQFMGGNRKNSRSKSTGEDLQIRVNISFDESIRGVTKTVKLRRYMPCKACDSKGGRGVSTCSGCAGTGYMRQVFQTMFGTMEQKVVCQKCNGSTKEFKEVCKICRGEGRIDSDDTIEIAIPAGIEDNETLRIKGYGHIGVRKKPAGDLYINVSVSASKSFMRDKYDLSNVMEIDVFKALYGGDIMVKTFYGEVKITLSELTPYGKKYRIKGAGVRTDKHTGDHIVEIRYSYPTHLDTDKKRILENLVHTK